jgi:hypothetical protein
MGERILPGKRAWRWHLKPKNGSWRWHWGQFRYAQPRFRIVVWRDGYVTVGKGKRSRDSNRLPSGLQISRARGASCQYAFNRRASRTTSPTLGK